MPEDADRKSPARQPEAAPKADADPPAEPDTGRHVADEPVMTEDAPEATVQSPATETGLPVADQVRKEWDPNKDGGLPTFLPDRGTGARR